MRLFPAVCGVPPSALASGVSSAQAVFLLEEFVAVPKLGHLDVEALADGTDPRICNKSHSPFLVFHYLLDPMKIAS